MKKNMYLVLSAALAMSCGIVQAGTLSFVTGEQFHDGGSIHSVNWYTNSVDYIAYGGYNGTENDNIRIAQFNNTALDVLSKNNYSEQQGSFVNALTWTIYGEALRLAVGGYKNNVGDEIKVYSYNNQKLQMVAATDMPVVNALDWFNLEGTYYLAVGGFNDKQGQEVRVYSYINDTLTLLPNATATYFHGQANTVKWFFRDGTIYLATGGFELGVSTDTNVRVYSFDAGSGTLTLVATQSINDFEPVYSVSWLEDGACAKLAATGHDGEDNLQTRVFSFMGSSLNEVASASFNYGAVYSSDWLDIDGTFYLAVCGDDGSNGQEVRVYSFIDSALTLIASIGLTATDVSSLQWATINGISYLAIGTNGDVALLIYQFTPSEV